MKCPYCHEVIDDDARRCKHCAGELLPCPNCRKSVGVETKSKFVGLARGGTKDVKKCLQCGKILYGPQCFIATAVYGSQQSPEVVAFRRFRDDILTRTPVGRALVSLYYRLGPAVARPVAEIAWMRRASRWFLDCVLARIERRAGRYRSG